MLQAEMRLDLVQAHTHLGLVQAQTVVQAQMGLGLVQAQGANLAWGQRGPWAFLLELVG